MVPIFSLLKILVRFLLSLPSASWTVTPPFVAISAAISLVVIPPVPQPLFTFPVFFKFLLEDFILFNWISSCTSLIGVASILSLGSLE